MFVKFTGNLLTLRKPQAYVQTDLYAGISVNASASESQVSCIATQHVAMNLMVAPRHPKLVIMHVRPTRGNAWFLIIIMYADCGVDL